MSEVVNLGKARKAKARQGAAAAAAENRVRFGRTKARKGTDAAETAKARGALDGAKREP